MANAWYDSAASGFLACTLAWNNTGGTLKVQLIDTALYTFSQSDNFFDDIAAGAKIGTATALANPAIVTTTAGTVAVDADDLTISNVSGATVEALVIFKDTGVASTSPLILYIDTATSLPFTPNGGDVLLAWDAGNSRIAALVNA